jgi:hypothetical protein
MLTKRELGFYNDRHILLDHPHDLPMSDLPPPAYKAAVVGPPHYETPIGDQAGPSTQHNADYTGPPPDYDDRPALNSAGSYELGVTSSPSAMPAAPTPAHVSST